MANYISTGILGSQYDAARVILGGDWSIPTKNQWQELIDECTWEYELVGSIRLAKITGPSGAIIYLPFAGMGTGTTTASDKDGYYMSSTLASNTTIYMVLLEYFNSNFRKTLYGDRGRPFGYSIRPVSMTEGVDLGLTSGLLWSDKNLGAANVYEKGDFYAFGMTETSSNYAFDAYICTLLQQGTSNDPLTAEYLEIIPPEPPKKYIDLVAAKAIFQHSKRINTETKYTGLETEAKTVIDAINELKNGDTVYVYKGRVATTANLPNADMEIGDVYHIDDIDENHYWDGTLWKPVLGTVQVKVECEADVDLSTTSENAVLNKVITTALANKLDKLTAGTNIRIQERAVVDGDPTQGTALYIDADDLIDDTVSSLTNSYSSVKTDQLILAKTTVSLTDTNNVPVVELSPNTNYKIVVGDNTYSFKTPDGAAYTEGTGISINSGEISLAGNVVTAGTAGPTDAVSQSSTLEVTIDVPLITVDEYGRITSYSNKILTLAKSGGASYTNGTGIDITDDVIGLTNTGVTAGSYGPISDTNGTTATLLTMSIPYITVDALGRITSISTKSLIVKNNTYTANNGVDLNGSTFRLKLGTSSGGYYGSMWIVN